MRSITIRLMSIIMKDTVEKDTVEILRLLASSNSNVEVMLPVEIIGILEGKIDYESMRKVSVRSVLNYLASMMEE